MESYYSQDESIRTNVTFNISSLFRSGPGNNTGITEARPQKSGHDENKQNSTNRWNRWGDVNGKVWAAESLSRIT